MVKVVKGLGGSLRLPPHPYHCKCCTGPFPLTKTQCFAVPSNRDTLMTPTHTVTIRSALFEVDCLTTGHRTADAPWGHSHDTPSRLSEWVATPCLCRWHKTDSGITHAPPGETMPADAQVFFDERFLDNHAGSIIRNPVIALIELIANAWDAGATRVDVTWPDPDQGSHFQICDNGIGMTYEDLVRRWLTLDYNRVAEQGEWAEFPPELSVERRHSFGRNGRGRYAGFLFSSTFALATSPPSGDGVVCRVSRGRGTPLEIELLERIPGRLHGTCITADEVRAVGLSADAARTEIGTRFLADPGFVVAVNDVLVTFDELPDERIRREVLAVGSYGHAEVYVLDASATDRSTKQHGIAWRVRNRLVGEVSWRTLDSHQSMRDGRTVEARRYTFIILADGLGDSVLDDWSGFREDEKWRAYSEVVHNWILEYLGELTRSRRKSTRDAVMQRHNSDVRRLPPSGRERWKAFVDKVVAECPSVREAELMQVAGILATLERATSRYEVLERLHTLEPDDFDSLNSILREWDVNMAKAVLDELKWRLKLLSEIREKTSNPGADEVQELQPLFSRGLWILGPEFETIEYTSNRSMNTVIRELLRLEIRGSGNRPDFVILPDGSVSCHSYPDFDEQMSEIGIRQVVLLELKRAGVTVAEEQKGQAYKYVRELYERGVIQQGLTEVRCFVLGSLIDQLANSESTHNDGRVRIIPMHYSTFVNRAESRTFKLLERIKGAAFLDEDEFTEYIDDEVGVQREMEMSYGAPNDGCC